jgi:cytochrome c oxidase subunit II
MHLFRYLPLRRRPALILALAIPALLAGCIIDGNQSPFETAGPVAEDQKNLFVLIFWLAVAVFVVVEAALFYSIFKFRRKGSGGAMPKQVHGNTMLELGWTIAPVFVLLAIALPTVFLIFDQDKGPVDGHEPQNALTINAVGHQWWFEFEYPGEDVITANELHIPVDRAIDVQLYSDDVIHSFWIPQLAGKVDMIPGTINSMFIQADASTLREDGTQEFRGQCAEFCGEAHANMRFRVIAHTAEGYEDWLDGMRRPPLDPEPGSAAAAGRLVFAQNCTSCHTINSYQPAVARAERETQIGRLGAFKANPEGSRIISAPNLTHLGQRSHFAAGISELTAENLRNWITDPDDIKQGNRMSKMAPVYTDPDFALEAQEIDQLVAYLMSQTPAPADAVLIEETSGPDGAAVFQTAGCAGCHSTGTNTIVGPGLSGLGVRAGDTVAGLSAEEYVRESIVDPGAFVIGGGDVSAMPSTFGATLRGNEINALIEYLLGLE